MKKTYNLKTPGLQGLKIGSTNHSKTRQDQILEKSIQRGEKWRNIPQPIPQIGPYNPAAKIRIVWERVILGHYHLQ